MKGYYLKIQSEVTGSDVKTRVMRRRTKRRLEPLHLRLNARSQWNLI